MMISTSTKGEKRHEARASRRAEPALREREEEAGRLAREDVVIAEIGRIISSSLEIHRVYEEFAEQVRQLTPFDRITISEVDFEARTLTPAYVAGLQVAGWEQGKTHPLSHSRLEPVVYEGACLLFDDESTEQHAQQNPETAAGAHAGLLSGVAVPLISRGQVVGALNLSSFNANAYSEEDLHLVERVAAQIAGTISNSQLYAAYRRAEGRRRELAVMEERNRLAREIHDTLAQSLTGLVLRLGTASATLNGQTEAQAELDSARRLAQQALEEARRAVWDLQPRALESSSLTEAIRMEVARASEGGVPTFLEVRGSEPSSMDSRQELCVLRIAQEAISNLCRHADAKTAMVKLVYDQTDVQLQISDDGVGFELSENPTQTAGNGFGLSSMQERARLAGGLLQVTSTPGVGTEIDARIPYQPLAEAAQIPTKTPAAKVAVELAASDPIKVLVVDDHEVVRQGIASMLRRTNGVAVAGEARDGEEALSMIERLDPDVVLLDVQMPKLDGVQTVRRLRELGSETRVILLSTYAKDEYIFDGLKAGARGYMLKDVARDDLVEAIRIVHAGESMLPPVVASRLITRLDAAEPSLLTERELEVLRLVASGARNKDIAEQLSLSVRTVRFHIENIYQKLGVQTRTQAVRVATERHLLG